MDLTLLLDHAHWMVAAGGLGLVATVLGQPALQYMTTRRQVAERLKTQDAAPPEPEARHTEKLLERLGRAISPGDSADITKIRQRMINAGYFSKSAPFWFLGLRLLALVVPQILLVTAWPFFGHALPIPHALAVCSVSLAVVGFIAPSFLLDKQVAKRVAQYREGFPDMMDLLVACVEAGLSLDAAVGRVAEELVSRYPNLSDQLKVMTLELRAGRDRQTAWKNFADRLGLDEARSLATMLRQSEELGTSIGETLRVFADDMREKRMLYAEEKALALPAKLVLPLILFVFPSLLGVLMLPAVVRMMWVFEQQGG